MKKKLVAAILAGLTMTVATPAFVAANSFADVPANHWAYNAVNTLAADGIIDGYGDGTFKGDKLMTRYEMAQIVARAYNNYETAQAQDKALMDKLAKEFGDELKALGVRVAILEKNQSNIKVTGESRIRYMDSDQDLVDGTDSFDMRQRLYLNAKINDNVSYTGRLEATFKTGSNNGETRFNQNYFTITDVGIDKMLIGRVPALAGKTLNVGKPADNDGIILVQKAGDVTFTGFVLDEDHNTQFNGIYAGIDLGKNADLEVGFTRGDAVSATQPQAETFDIGASVQLGKGYSFVAEYVDTDNKDAADGDGYAVQLVKGVKTTKIGTIMSGMNIVDKAKPHTSGFLIGYRELEDNALWNDGTASRFNKSTTLNGGEADNVKGMYYAFQHVLAKNTIFSLEYQDMEREDNGDDVEKSLAAHVQFWF